MYFLREGSKYRKIHTSNIIYYWHLLFVSLGFICHCFIIIIIIIIIIVTITIFTIIVINIIVIIITIWLALMTRIAFLKVVSTFLMLHRFYSGVILAPCAWCVCNFVFFVLFCVYCDWTFYVTVLFFIFN